MSTPIVKWVTKTHNHTIKRVVVEKETPRFVYVKSWLKGEPHREAKVSEFTRYHDSFEAARDYLIERTERAIARARGRLAGELAGLELVRQAVEPPESDPWTNP